MKLKNVLKKLNTIGKVETYNNVYSITLGNNELSFIPNKIDYNGSDSIENYEVRYYTIDSLDVESYDADYRTFQERRFSSFKQALLNFGI